MGIFQNATRRSVLEGSGFLIVVLGAGGAHFSKWGVYGFHPPDISLWGFVCIASIGGVFYFLAPMIFGTVSVKGKGGSFEYPERMLVLYLRPFELDARSFLQLALGASSGILVYATLLHGMWILSFLPLMVNISIEQSLRQVFEPWADFIAFGEPGRRLHPIGAFRYRIGDNWREEITRYMNRARLVIIRPGGSKSIRWEMNQVLRTVPPERILFYLRFHGLKKRKQREYETFRQLLQADHAIALPESQGNARYLVFDHNWRPSLLKRSNHPMDIVRQLPFGDFNRDRFQPVLDALHLELPPVRPSLSEKIMMGIMWSLLIISVGLAFVATVYLAIVIILVWTLP